MSCVTWGFMLLEHTHSLPYPTSKVGALGIPNVFRSFLLSLSPSPFTRNSKTWRGKKAHLFLRKMMFSGDGMVRRKPQYTRSPLFLYLSLSLSSFLYPFIFLSISLPPLFSLSFFISFSLSLSLTFFLYFSLFSSLPLSLIPSLELFVISCTKYLPIPTWSSYRTYIICSYMYHCTLLLFVVLVFG